MLATKMSGFRSISQTWNLVEEAKWGLKYFTVCIAKELTRSAISGYFRHVCMHVGIYTSIFLCTGKSCMLFSVLYIIHYNNVFERGKRHIQLKQSLLPYSSSSPDVVSIHTDKSIGHLMEEGQVDFVSANTC